MSGLPVLRRLTVTRLAILRRLGVTLAVLRRLGVAGGVVPGVPPAVSGRQFRLLREREELARLGSPELDDRSEAYSPLGQGEDEAEYCAAGTREGGQAADQPQAREPEEDAGQHAGPVPASPGFPGHPEPETPGEDRRDDPGDKVIRGVHGGAR